jgi:hypothetical protein
VNSFRALRKREVRIRLSVTFEFSETSTVLRSNSVTQPTVPELVKMVSPSRAVVFPVTSRQSA